MMGKAAHQGCRHLCVLQYVDPLRELQIRIKDEKRYKQLLKDCYQDPGRYNQCTSQHRR